MPKSLARYSAYEVVNVQELSYNQTNVCEKSSSQSVADSLRETCTMEYYVTPNTGKRWPTHYLFQGTG
jgi:hypothetical protein